MTRQLEDLDVGELGARVERVAQRWRAGARVDDIVPLTGGRSSLTFSATLTVGRDAIPVVIKVAPPGLAPVRNRDVLRQARVMRALADAPGVEVPAVLFTDAGDPPQVPPLLVMEHVPGDSCEPVLSAPEDRPPAGLIHRRALEAARILAALHRARPHQLGLTGEPVVTLESEVERWTRALETVSDDLRSGYQACRDALVRSVPRPLPASIVHGDYRLGNLLCQGDRVRAVIDWEIWARSDPRVDLSWYVFFAQGAGNALARPGPSGMPSVVQLLEAYDEAGGPEHPELEWFHALTRYKEAGATALIVKRQRRSAMPAADTEQLAEATPRFIEDALDILRPRRGARR